MPNPPVAISDAESRVMEVLWQKAPQTSEDIVAALLAPTGWHEKTIKTLLNRLLGKGAVSAEKDGRRYLYSPQTSEDIVAALLAPTGWHEKTIKTLLNRLLGKGAVSAEKDGRRYLYSPQLRREDWQQLESRSLLDRVFGGKVAPLLAHFSQHEKLSARDVAELRKLIDSIDKKGR